MEWKIIRHRPSFLCRVISAVMFIVGLNLMKRKEILKALSSVKRVINYPEGNQPLAEEQL